MTGILLYNGGHFLQLLEGKAIVVRRLFEKIRPDRRHQNVRQLVFLPVEARMFQGWHMGMLNRDDRRNATWIRPQTVGPPTVSNAGRASRTQAGRVGGTGTRCRSTAPRLDFPDSDRHGRTAIGTRI